MRRFLTIAILFYALVLAGCGNDQLTEDESERAWNSTQQTLTSGEARVQGEGSGSEEGSDSDLTVDYTCPEGGTARFEGSYTFENSGNEGSDHAVLETDLTVSFDACANNNITADGFINYTTRTETNDSGAEFVTDWTGDLDYSGEINGTCQIDMHGEMSAESGSESVSYQYDYSGTVCGHDADQTLEGSGSFSYDY